MATAFGQISAPFVAAFAVKSKSGIIGDDFERASLGSNWASPDSDNGTPGIVSSHYLGITVGTWTLALYTPDGTSSNQVCEGQIASATQAGMMYSVCVRTTPGATESPRYGFHYNLSLTRWELKYDGVASPVVLATTSSYPAPVAGDILKIKAIGTSIRGYLNGVMILQATDSRLSVGYPGVAIILGPGTLPAAAFEWWAGGQAYTHTFTGSMSMALDASFVIQAQKTTFGQIVAPFTFSKDVSGRRETFGQIIFPINATFVVTGDKQGGTRYGQLAIDFVFDEQIAGYRETFGQIAIPYLFATTLSGTKTTFGQLESQIDFIIDAKTGRVEAHSTLAFELLLGLETAGIIRPSNIILNMAKAIYLGSTSVDAIYIDSQKVWPK